MPNSQHPNDHPDEQDIISDDGVPKFGRLLLVLLGAVVIITIVTFVSLAYYGK